MTHSNLDTSAEALRSRIESMAQTISERMAASGGVAVPEFIGDIVDAVGDVVGDVVNGAVDAANEVANVATQVANVVGQGVQDVQQVANAAEAAVNEIGGLANLVTNFADNFAGFADFIGGFFTEPGGTQGAAAPSSASAAQLVKARHQALMERRSTTRSSIQAQVRTLRSKVSHLAAQARSSQASGPQ